MARPPKAEGVEAKRKEREGPNSLWVTVGDLGVWEECRARGYVTVFQLSSLRERSSPNSVNLGVRKGHLERKEILQGATGQWEVPASHQLMEEQCTCRFKVEEMLQHYR